MKVQLDMSIRVFATVLCALLLSHNSGYAQDRNNPEVIVEWSSNSPQRTVTKYQYFPDVIDHSQKKPAGQNKASGDDLGDFSLELPTPSQLFRPESEAQSRARIRQRAYERKITKVEFPKDSPLVYEREMPSYMKPYQVITFHSECVFYRPLYFEEKRIERYRHYVPGLVWITSPALFYARGITLPARMIIRPPWGWQSSHP